MRDGMPERKGKTLKDISKRGGIRFFKYLIRKKSKKA